LDFAFFRDRIQPLRADAQANFHAASRKVNLLDPAESPLLIKPLLPGITSDGDAFRTCHNGGDRWPARTGGVEYQTSSNASAAAESKRVILLIT